MTDSNIQPANEAVSAEHQRAVDLIDSLIQAAQDVVQKSGAAFREAQRELNDQRNEVFSALRAKPAADGEVERLRGALAPFVAVAEAHAHNARKQQPDDTVWFQEWGEHVANITLGDLRRAADATRQSR
ncbi:MAG: hypothetical protein ABIO35_08390 [Nitrobacter sp.]